MQSPPHGRHLHVALMQPEPLCQVAQTPQLQAGQATVVAHPLVVKTQAYQTRNDAVEEPLFALNLNPAYTIALQNNGAAPLLLIYQNIVTRREGSIETE